MYLTTQNKRAFIAKKDLKTYKVLCYYIDDSNERVYRTLCKNYPVKLSSVMRPEPLGKDEYPFKEKGIYYEIGKGFIHPLDYGEGMENDIIGIVAKVTDDNVYVISLHVNRCQYAYEPCDKGKLKDEDKYFYPAIDFCKEYSTWGTKKGEVIPAWSKYFQGTDNNDKYCYASKKIMIE